MKTIDISPDEMEKHIARFDELETYQSAMDRESAIPAKLMAELAAGEVFSIMAPEGMPGRHADAPVKSLPGMTVGIAVCPPGDGPVLHAHSDSHETFLCLKGEFDIIWGDEGQHKTTLRPYDLISVPPRVMRTFRNVSDEDAHLLAFHQGNEDMKDATIMDPALGERVASEFGQDVVDAMAARNMLFTAGRSDPADAADPSAQER
ncbi:MAG: cupin domain-containing protein [Alphaproteobacteria bacterium]|nr:cupin domain-containing protein [Alphaproteobacteria bacterium]